MAKLIQHVVAQFEMRCLDPKAAEQIHKLLASAFTTAKQMAKDCVPAGEVYSDVDHHEHAQRSELDSRIIIVGSGVGDSMGDVFDAIFNPRFLRG